MLKGKNLSNGGEIGVAKIQVIQVRFHCVQILMLVLHHRNPDS